MEFVNQLLTHVPFPVGSYAGKTIVVTGSNTGLGKEAARHYARLGAQLLILAVRNVDKGTEAKNYIESSTSCGKDVVQVWPLDMSSYDSVKKFAARVNSELDRVDIFNANAGVAKGKFSLVEGEEETIVVNVISTFLLAALVLPKLKETAKKYNSRPTLSITSSGAHAYSTFPQKDAPEGQLFATISTENYFAEYRQQYPLSKMLEIFAVRSIAAQAPSFPVTINCVCPGFCHSELSRDYPTWGFYLMKLFLARTTEQGSRTLVHSGSAGKETHGQFLSHCKIAQPAKVVTENPEVQERVWMELVEKLDRISPGCTEEFKAKSLSDKSSLGPPTVM